MNACQLVLSLLAAPAPTVEHIERSALEARTRIRTMYVELRVESGGGGADEAARRKLWLDGEHVRGEIVRERGGDAGVRFVDCVNCDKPGWGVEGNTIPNNASRFRPLGDRSAPGFVHAVDPRLLGYYPVILASLSRGRLDGVVGRTDRDLPAVAREAVGADDTWVLRWRSRQNVRFVVWVAPSKGWNVVKMELTGPEDGAPPYIQTTVESDVQRVGASDVWYPRKVSLVQVRGAENLLKETINVEKVVANEPIAPETFRLSGLGLPENTYFTSTDRNVRGFLRDGKIVSNQRRSDLPDTTPVAEARALPRVLWVVTACLSGLAAVAVVVSRRWARAPQS